MRTIIYILVLRKARKGKGLGNILSFFFMLKVQFLIVLPSVLHVSLRLDLVQFLFSDTDH